MQGPLLTYSLSIICICLKGNKLLLQFHGTIIIHLPQACEKVKYVSIVIHQSSRLNISVENKAKRTKKETEEEEVKTSNLKG